MSPYEISILLHYYCRVEDHGDIQRNPPIWGQTIRSFKVLGLIRDDDSHEKCYAITERGRAYCEALQRVPLPVSAWVIPKKELTALLKRLA